MTYDPTKFFRPLGNVDPKHADWVEQDGVFYFWSESNYQYERAWWIDNNIKVTPLVANLRRERGYPPAQCPHGVGSACPCEKCSAYWQTEWGHR